MHAASLNHVFRLVWSDRLQAWVAVAEGSPSQGKGGRGGRAARVAAAVLALAGASGMAMAAGASLPTGGQVVQGGGNISQSGNTLTIHQNSARLVTNWQSFNIGAGQVVQFNQPSANAVALNRVLGGEVSNIQGALRANGQVFLLNPNGVLFGATARVDTGGLVASTLSMSDADFMAGRYHLEGDSTASVVNQGQILVRNGGGLALVAAKVVNQGEMRGDGGLVALASGNDVTLDFGGAVQLQVNRGALDSLIENGGAVRADGGHVIFTAKAADALSRSVINQTGVVRARTLSTGAQGEIDLIGDMDHGQLKAGGVIDASAPDAGNGGHIETSAADVQTLAGLKVDAGSRFGQGGTWLIDPYDYTINAAAAGNITSALNTGTNVTVTTQSNVSGYGSGGSSSGNGDITVSSAINKTSGGNATLTLRADRSIAVNSAITSTSGQLGITLSAANNASSSVGGVNVAANLSSNGGRILIGGAGGNQTTATSYGIGYAINGISSGNPTAAVIIGTNTTIASAGGDITINGRSNATTNGSYSGTKGGIYVLSGATVDSGGGMLYISGLSAGAGNGAGNVFGFSVEANATTLTTFKTSSTTGAIVVDAQNATDALGALGLVNNGGQAKVQFWAPSVAHMLFRINGNNKATTFTQSPPCNPGYPNCGTMVIPGGNQSYTSAGYNVVNMAMVPLYIFSGSATRVYDGTTNATGMTLTSLGGPNGFGTGDLGSLSFNTPNKAVGSYTSVSGAVGNPSNYTSGGTTYAVAYYNQGTYTITQKTISSFSAGNKVYDGTMAASVTGSGIIGGDAVTVNATGGFASAGVGNGIAVNVSGVSLSGADAGNYTVSGGGSISTTANITPAPLTVTANAASKTYDGLAYSGNAGVSYSGFVNSETSSVLGGSLSYMGSSQGAINAGSYVITPQGLTAGNYSISYVGGALTVNPATLTYTANSASRTYGASNAAFSGTVTGFVNSETLASATTGTAGFLTAATSASNAGSYAVNGSGLTANNGNYTFVQAAGNSTALTVTPAALTVTAANASKTYNGVGYSGGNGVSYSGFVNGDTSSALGGSLSYAGSSQGAVNAGSYVITPQGLSSGNYSLSYVDGSLTVNAATLTYTANSASRTYGASNPGLSGSVTGLVNGETLSGATTGTLSFSTAASSGSNVGSYGVTGSGLTANHGNYTFVQAAGNSTALTVSPATLTVTAASDSKTYDGLAYSGGNGVSYSGFANGDTSSVLGGSLSYAGTSQSATNAGSYAITPQGLSAGNYSLSYVSGNLTVNPATLTYTANVASRTYGASNPGLSGTVTGFVNGETVSSATSGAALFSTTATSASNVGGYGVNGSGLTANHGNYTFTQAAGNSTALTVNPATLTVTAANASKTYDSNAYSGGNGVSYSGFVNGDTASVLSGTVSYGGSSQGAVNVGSYTIMPSGLSASNYALSYVNGALTVSTASLALITGSLTGSIGKLYDGGTVATLAPGNYLLSGWQGNDGATVTKTTGTYDNANVGSNKMVTVSLTSGDFAATGNTVLANYQLPTSVTGSIGHITPAPLTITAATSTKTYDGGVSSMGTPVVSGLVGSDTVSGLSQVYANKNAGTGKTINVSGYTVNDGNNGGNYTVTTVDSASSAITRANATVTGSATSVTYDGSTRTQGAATSSGFLNGDSISVAGLASGRNAGTYHSSLSVTGSDADNYNVTVTNADLVIGRAALTITAAQDSKVYDGGVLSTLTPTVSGLLGSDTVSGLSQAYANKNAGSGKAISVGGYTVNDGHNGGNYDVTTVDNTSGLITPATLTVTVDGASRSAGTGNPVFTGTVTGFVGADNLANATTGSLSFLAEANTTSPTGSYAVVGQGLSALHGNYVLTQAQGNARALTVTTALPAVDQFLPKATPVPNFPDNALHALGATPNSIGAGNLNYVSLNSGSPAPAAPSSPSAVAPNNASADVGGNSSDASRSSSDSTGAANTSSGGSRGRTARPGSAGTAVPSANGPLDIFVIDGGINAGMGSPTGNQAK